MKKDKTTNNPATLPDKLEALRKFRFNIAGSKIKNVREGRALRRDIARMHTQNSQNQNAK